MTTAVYRHLPKDLGLEAPLSNEGGAVETLVRGRVNRRWLAGTVLVGLAGSGLLLLAVAGALDPLRNIVTSPELARGREDRGVTGNAIVARRGDKLVRRANLVAARQDYKVPLGVRTGNTEVTRNFGFTRLSSPLALETLGYSDAVPAFNLARLVSLASEERIATEGEFGGTQDSEIALALHPLERARTLERSAIALGDSDAAAQVLDFLSDRRRDTTRTAGQTRLARVMQAPAAPSPSLGFAGAVSEPFSKLVVRMVPENVSVLPRQEAVLTPFPTEERIVVVRNAAHAGQQLRGLGAEARQVTEIVAALTRNGKAANLEANRLMKVTLQPIEPGTPRQLMRVDLFADEQLIASTGRRDDGSFWPIEVRETPSPDASRPESEEEAEENPSRLTLYASIHETARRYEIAPSVIEEVIRTVFFDVDLQLRVSPGDSIEMLVANGDGDAAKPELQLVALTFGGLKRRYFRFKLPEDDVVDFFDEQGRSAKQFLLRKPVDGGELRSGFGMRRHPILRYYRLHSGVDWAGRVGTTIRAAGNGVVRLAEWDSGYGRRVEIEHNHGYVTTYSHLSAFGPGIKEGVRVRQGQIIGRLGSSGLSTGPHLHYEVKINDRFVDPLAIKLPRGRELNGARLAEFKREREQIESILKRAPGSSAVLAQN